MNANILLNLVLVQKRVLAFFSARSFGQHRIKSEWTSCDGILIDSISYCEGIFLWLEPRCRCREATSSLYSPPQIPQVLSSRSCAESVPDGPNTQPARASRCDLQGWAALWSLCFGEFLACWAADLSTSKWNQLVLPWKVNKQNFIRNESAGDGYIDYLYFFQVAYSKE